mmetsp:Transcript_145730/g.254278  ORF Transcript_145730/g.254278 Transcript_145730/m.254278 type:complete len:92 (+) Transcript_145730:108-383(+)
MLSRCASCLQVCLVRRNVLKIFEGATALNVDLRCSTENVRLVQKNQGIQSTVTHSPLLTIKHSRQCASQMLRAQAPCKKIARTEFKHGRAA